MQYSDIMRLPDGREIIYATGIELPDVRTYVHKGQWASALVQEPLRDGRWRELAPFGPQIAGDVGGDDQVSEAHSRRFARQHADGSWSVYDTTYYVVRRDGQTYIERQTGYCQCSDPHDPGSTETWADYRFGRLTGTTEADAIVHCAAVTTDEITWDGTEVPR